MYSIGNPPGGGQGGNNMMAMLSRLMAMNQGQGQQQAMAPNAGPGPVMDNSASNILPVGSEGVEPNPAENPYANNPYYHVGFNSHF